VDKEIDDLELDWWNKNAEIISKVWEMDPAISWDIRKEYLLRAKSFFQKGSRKVTILEIGCGSGWVGQSIVNDDFRLIGTDFSQEQIYLANENARRKNLENYCQYILLRSDVFPNATTQINGVLIHCLLHHLTNKEIKEFFEGLKLKIKSGSKIFIYEPAFFEFASNSSKKLDTKSFILLNISKFMDKCLIFLSHILRIGDQKTKNEFDNLLHQAEEKGWCLSPKEVPLNITEFKAILQEYCIIDKSYWKTLYSIGWGSTINNINNTFLRRLLGEIFIPIYVYTDKCISKNSGYLRNEFVEPKYAFHIWECFLK
jgi:2-polyprenyl-3-methyl-5-hydroxy-6-metoxy-1,4-benzoquinol methylase